MNIHLTIIIPVYCVSDTLERCLNSVTGQQCDGLEIILIDDGSPDYCPQICDEWAQRDRRITVIHKQNGGLSSARNAGLDIARGNYITFVDPDDYIADNTMQSLADILREHPEYDILEYPVSVLQKSGKQSAITFDKEVFTDMSEYWMRGRSYQHNYVWNKIFRRHLFDGIRFPEGLVFEDVYIMPQILKHAHVVATTDKGMYCYCFNKHGITSTAGPDEYGMLLDAHLQVIDMFRDHPLFYTYYMHVLNIQITMYDISGYEPRLERIRITEFSGLNFMMKVKAVLLNLFGIKGLCIIFKILNRARRLR